MRDVAMTVTNDASGLARARVIVDDEHGGERAAVVDVLTSVVIVVERDNASAPDTLEARSRPLDASWRSSSS